MTEQKTQEIALTGSCSAGIAWDFVDKAVDLDMSVIALNKTGKIIDVAYYNKTNICDKNIVHSGDIRDGYKQGDDEYVDIELDHLKGEVKALFFLVNVFKGGNFRDVKKATFTLYKKKKTCYSHSFGKFSKTGYLIGALFRSRRVWKFKSITTTCTGKNFEESIPSVTKSLPQIPIYDEEILTDEPNDPDKTYNLTKNETYTFAKEIVQVTIGLGWDPSDMIEQIDVDAGVILLTEEKESVEIVNWTNLKYKNQVIHNGDNLTGDGDGDDEQIDLYLYEIDRKICYMAIGICVYTQGVSFKQIKNCFVRLINHDGFELCRFNISGNYKSNAMIMGYLYKNSNGYWGFKSGGIPSTGTMIKDLVTPVQKIIENGKEPDEDTYDKIQRQARKYEKENNIN